MKPAKPAPFRRVFTVATVTVLCLVPLGFGAMIARKGLENRALDRCVNEPTAPGQLGVWRWWPPGYDCAAPASVLTTHGPRRDVRRCAAGGVLGTFRELGGVGLPPGMNPARFEIRTIWIRQRAGLLEIAYAGANLVGGRRAGLSLLFVKPGVGLPESGSGFYALPQSAPRLTLTCVRKNTLFVRYRGGRGTFNFRTHRWFVSA